MKAILNWRYHVLWAIGLVAVLGLFSVPQEDATMTQYFIGLFATKSIGIAAAYVFYRLVTKWEKMGVIPELTELAKEED